MKTYKIISFNGEPGSLKAVLTDINQLPNVLTSPQAFYTYLDSHNQGMFYDYDDFVNKLKNEETLDADVNKSSDWQNVKNEILKAAKTNETVVLVLGEEGADSSIAFSELKFEN